MPSYNYKCKKCGHTFKELSSVAEGEKTLRKRCTECGGKVERPFTLNVPVIHTRGYSPAHPRFFRGMRKR